MKQLMALFPYNVLLIIVGAVELAKWLLYLLHKSTIQVFNHRARANVKMDLDWGQKFGLMPRRLPKKIRHKSVLFHCASMGEVTATIGLIREILKQHPEHYVVVTTNTLTGKHQLQRRLSDEMGKRVFHTYLPIDLPWMMSALLRQVKPVVTLIMEVELWPNLIRKCRAKKIPVVVVNARMTDKTKRGYQRFSWLSGQMIKSLSKVLARNQDDFDRYVELGLPESRIEIVGNLKFDIEVPASELSQITRKEYNVENRLVFIAGSTHLDEEEVVISTYVKLKKSFPELLLVIAPRHPERFQQVLEYLLVQDVKIAQLSLDESVTDKIDVLLVDKMGELNRLYGAADVAFVGGSIAEKGGHNPLEASAYAKPVVMGPHVYNNSEVCSELVEAGGLVIANSEPEFTQIMTGWLSNKEAREAVGKAGLNAILSHAEMTATITTVVYNIIND
ncbi:lipid IV(A) 3-deoxy-D-manno-octulosonic acid transferase [Psychrosphaera haliotis]|uniref:3-deoxy-D-manno-octulosonic acid transferase n=1 Tax=Psychrosphaera haliotis TaxID=555083 RepID=UPI0031DB92ED